jgi:hypothetical protein
MVVEEKRWILRKRERRKRKDRLRKRENFLD